MITPRHAASIGSRYFSGNLAGALAGVAVAGLFLLTPAVAQAQVPDATKNPPKTAPATHITNDQIEAFIAQLPRNRISDNPIRNLDVGGYRVGVFAVFRPKDSPQDAIYHDTNMTEILYIIRGSANLITGGTIPDARPPQRPGGNYTGTKIDGGAKRHVVPGDVIVTPGRTPHLWADIESDMSYLVFRPDPENTLTLK